MTKRAWITASFGLFAVGAAFSACVDDGTSPLTPTNDAGAIAPVPTGTGTGTTPNPSPDPVDDAGVLVDGGLGDPDDGDGGVDPDAGLLDAGPDGGACGPVGRNGASVNSACSQRATIPLGGEVPAGVYELVDFVVLARDCTLYRPSPYEGRLDVSVVGRGRFRLAERSQRSGGLTRAIIRDVNAAVDGERFTVTSNCGEPVSDTNWPFSVSVAGGATLLEYVHRSGSATVRYRWRLVR